MVGSVVQKKCMCYIRYPVMSAMILYGCFRGTLVSYIYGDRGSKWNNSQVT